MSGLDSDPRSSSASSVGGGSSSSASSVAAEEQLSPSLDLANSRVLLPEASQGAPPAPSLSEPEVQYQASADELDLGLET